MSMALGHFAVGAACTLVVVTYLVPSVPYPRVAVLLGGVWGMLPDVHWVSPVFTEQLRAAHGSPLSDVFWFHRTMDVLDRTDSPAVSAGAFAALLIVTVLAERREYRALAAVRARTGDGPRDRDR